jgi:hypothetical protein
MTKTDDKTFFDLADEYQSHRQVLTMWPRQWKKYRAPKNLRWRSLEFSDDARGKVPRKPGVYAFSVKPSVANLGVSYLMYVGMTNRTLRERFAEYLKERSPNRGRPKLAMLFHHYRGFVHFNYAYVKPPHTLKQVEDRLLAAFVPPANDRLPATISKVVRAFP